MHSHRSRAWPRLRLRRPLSGLPIAHWRYDIAPPRAAAAGSSNGPGIADPAGSARPRGSATGVRDRDAANAEHIKLTLERLKEKAEARLGPAGDLVGDDGDR